MRVYTSRGIVLGRVDYGEADRIINWLTPDNGKLSLLARGVRKQKSKLAGGIELFSESNISFIRGRGEVGTLTSSRLICHYENIVKDLKHSDLAFMFIKIINKTVERGAGQEWYEFLKSALSGLNEVDLPLDLTQLWFNLQWLKLSGHSPNFRSDIADNRLETGKSYLFNFDKMAFAQKDNGPYRAEHIKLLRLGLSLKSPEGLAKVKQVEEFLPASAALSNTMIKQFVTV